MNKKSNKVLLAGDKFLREINLIQLFAPASLGKHSKHGFRFSACRTLTKNKEKVQEN